MHDGNFRRLPDPSPGLSPGTRHEPVVGSLLVSEEAAADELSEARAAVARATAHAEELQRALITSRQIGMATGILMERHRLTAEQAFDCLRDLSQRGNIKLRDIAEQMIYTGEAERRDSGARPPADRPAEVRRGRPGT